jgi:hypothetical protein
VTVLADELEPPGMVVELETEPFPAWTFTEEPPAVVLLDRPPADEPTELPPPAELLAREFPADEELMVEPPDAPAAVMLPSGFLFTVTVQVCPEAFLPCLVMVSACADAPARQVATATSTKAVLCAMACLPNEKGAAARPPRALPRLVLLLLTRRLVTTAPGRAITATARSLAGPAARRGSGRSTRPDR